MQILSVIIVPKFPNGEQQCTQRQLKAGRSHCAALLALSTALRHKLIVKMNLTRISGLCTLVRSRLHVTFVKLLLTEIDSFLVRTI